MIQCGARNLGYICLGRSTLAGHIRFTPGIGRPNQKNEQVFVNSDLGSDNNLSHQTVFGPATDALSIQDFDCVEV